MTLEFNRKQGSLLGKKEKTKYIYISLEVFVPRANDCLFESIFFIVGCHDIC